MLYPELEERLSDAKRALRNGTSGNVVELCQRYLTLLDAYRGELHKLAGTPAVKLGAGPSSPEEVKGMREAVRLAIENNTRERNRIMALLLSFTAVSGYKAVEVFNRRKYKGYDDWELKSGGVMRFSGGAALERMTIQEAVDTASLLLRTEYTAQNAASENDTLKAARRKHS